MQAKLMRGIVVQQLGWPQPMTIANCDIPVPGLHQVLVKVLYAGLNFADSLVVGGSYQEQPDLPFVPGAELCGEIILVGENVRGLAVGQRIMGQVAHGAFAEYAVVDQDRLTLIPSGMRSRDAAGFYIPFGTAECALFQRARLKSNEVVLVLGASGAVGQACAQLALAQGAKVICAASSIDRIPDELRQTVTWVAPTSATLRRDVMKETVGLGVDLVVDMVGGSVGEQAMRCLRFEGRFVIVGFAAGDPPVLRANHILVKNIDVLGCYWGPYQVLRPNSTRNAFDRLAHLFIEGAIRPLPIHVVELDEVSQALASLVERRQSGKVVVRIGADKGDFS